MSCYSRALPWLIPQLLLLSRTGSEVVIVSPWVEDVTLRAPITGQRPARRGTREVRLSELLLRLAKDYDVRVSLVVRERTRRLQRVVGPLRSQRPSHLRLREIPYLHAKLVVTESFAIETSANMLWTSLFRNVESCSLVSNPYGRASRFVAEKINLAL